MGALLRAVVLLQLLTPHIYAVPRPTAVAPPLLTPEVVVAVGPGASKQESWAAYSLAAGLGLAMGGPSAPYKYCAHPFSGGPTGKCGVVAPTEVGNRSAIYVGLHAAAAAGLHPTAAELREVGDDGFMCSASGTGESAFRVALTGGLTINRRGTINAVFVYLHRLGLRWWTPWKDVDATWTGPGIGRGLAFGMQLQMPGCGGRRVFTPLFQYRSILSYGILESSQSAIWNVQNHLNGGGDRTGECKSLVIPASMGGSEMFTNDTCAASVYGLVAPLPCVPPPWPGHPPGSKPGFCHEPTAGHFHEHPEFFSLLSPSAPSNASCATSPAHCIRAHNLSLDSADPKRPGSPPGNLLPGWRVGGVPGKGPWQAQLCMSSISMRSVMIAHAKAKLAYDKAHYGDVKYIAVADNDQAGAIGACECDKCTAARKRDGGSGLVCMGGQSGLSLSVANDLATALASSGYPDTLVSMQAYQDKLEPPRITRPHPNVRVQFTTMGQNQGRPLRLGGDIDDIEANTTLRQLREWARIAPGQVSIWDYGCNVANPLLLLPDWLKLGDDVALYRELNVSGVMMEACDTWPSADLHEMKAWMLSQLYMDRDANATELMLDFLVRKRLFCAALC
jgi:hypothetical protein|eukprot:COSAG06_NODE_6316_length_2987_cov_3.520776_2_plen_619_part_00